MRVTLSGQEEHRDDDDDDGDHRGSLIAGNEFHFLALISSVITSDTASSDTQGELFTAFGVTAP
jgi:hypothetical protein